MSNWTWAIKITTETQDEHTIFSIFMKNHNFYFHPDLKVFVLKEEVKDFSPVAIAFRCINDLKKYHTSIADRGIVLFRVSDINIF